MSDSITEEIFRPVLAEARLRTLYYSDAVKWRIIRLRFRLRSSSYGRINNILR